MRDEKISRFFLPQSPGAGPSSPPSPSSCTKPPSAFSSPTKEDLQQSWKTLYATTLPQLALSHSPAQPVWPIHLDHCFARIILDNVVGIDSPWTEVLKSPAWKTMSMKQLEGCLDLGRRIEGGEVDLVELDENSLRLRGKKTKTKSKETGFAKKELVSKEGGNQTLKPRRRQESMLDQKKTEVTPSPEHTRKRKFIDLTDDADNPQRVDRVKILKLATRPSPPLTSSTQPLLSLSLSSPSLPKPKPKPQSTTDFTPILHKLITNPSLSPFRRLTLLLIILIPPGRFSTYALLSIHLSSSPRAIGNALRMNPYAGSREGWDVPCHRVLATGGGIGGFGGKWGEVHEGGTNADEKRRLLRMEGVRFDVKGKAVGRGFDGWPCVQELERMLEEVG